MIKINFDVENNLKDGDMLIYKRGKFVAITKDELLHEIVGELKGIKDDIKTTISRLDTQERNNKNFLNNLKEVYKL